MSNMRWLLCDVRWTWLNNQMAKPDIGAIGPFGRRNKYIKHRTTAIGQLTTALPTTRRCQVCVRLILAKEGNLVFDLIAQCPGIFSRNACSAAVCPSVLLCSRASTNRLGSKPGNDGLSVVSRYASSSNT